MKANPWLCWALAVGLNTTACHKVASEPTPSSVPPRRVVSLIPSATELIFEVGAGDRLVGVTANDTYPPQVAALPQVGDQTIDRERLLSLKPDLVVLDSEFNADHQTYRRLGLPLLTLQSRRLADIPKNLRVLGQHLGLGDSGEAAAKRFESELEEIPKLQVKQTVFVEIWGSPLMTVGSESLPNDLLGQLGLENAYADQKGYFQVDPEDVVQRRPGIILLPAASLQERSVAASLLRRVGQSPRVIVIDGDLFTTPSPRVLEGMKRLAAEFVSSVR